jgi:broad specificity phosphatase PhoE
MTRILVIRHGETQWNIEKVFRGRADVPLSDRGREQARLTGQALASARLAAVYSSPLTRARDTAEAVAASQGLAVSVDQRLVDMSFGEWEGKPLPQVESAWPDLYRAWLTSPALFRAPGGESLPQVRARAWSLVEEVAHRHARGGVALVSHRVPCKLIMCCALGAGEAQFWRLRLDTASVSVIERSGEQWVVTRLNDTHHLRTIGEEEGADF